jgi:hypothetical protein
MQAWLIKAPPPSSSKVPRHFEFAVSTQVDGTTSPRAVGEQRPPEHALLDPSFEFADLRF